MAGARPRYTIEEANALLPQVRAVLLQLAVEKGRLEGAVASLVREHWGRGPQRCRAYWACTDAIVAILDGGHTPAERALHAAGHSALVLQARERVHELLEDDMRRLVEAQTGRGVVTVLHATRLDPELSAQIFVLRADDALVTQSA